MWVIETEALWSFRMQNCDPDLTLHSFQYYQEKEEASGEHILEASILRFFDVMVKFSKNSPKSAKNGTILE